jgi:Holliday junction DNA helicase RuvB
MTDREHAHNDNVLRPKTWSEYIGQDLIKHNIQILIKAASERNQTPEHMLFYGPPGLGKTTLAQLIALETGRAMKTTSGPALEKIGDLASLLTNVSPGDIIFIDEIHRLSKMIEEILYPAMESGVLDIVIGKGPTARTIQLELPPFTLVAATTRLALLSSPLRSRFSGGVFRLEYYSKDNIEQIISQSAQKLGIEISSDAVSEIARRSRFTPRTANYLLRRIRDYAQVHKTPINKESTGQALSLIGIDSHGLSASDRAYLEALITKFKGGPVGVKTLAAATGEEEGTIEDVIEPYLIQEGFIEKTPRGRIATDKAYGHIKS